MTNKIETNFNLSLDTIIKGYTWINPEVKPIGLVMISHGMAEHIDRYDKFAEFLTNNGYIVFGHNQRGHKDTITSKNDYGYMGEVDNFMILVNDLISINTFLHEKYPDLPIFLFGHSMGSFVSQKFAQLNGTKINGLILSGSSRNNNFILNMGLLVAKTIFKFKGPRYKSNLLDSMSFGSFNKKFKPNRTKFDWLNTDEKEVDKYINDEYCGGIFSTAYFKDFFSGLKDINKNTELISKDLPILIISGKEDPVGGMGKDVTSLYNVYKKNNIKDITFKLYDNARHEILLETNKNEVYSDVLNWLKNH